MDINKWRSTRRSVANIHDCDDDGQVRKRLRRVPQRLLGGGSPGRGGRNYVPSDRSYTTLRDLTRCSPVTLFACVTRVVLKLADQGVDAGRMPSDLPYAASPGSDAVDAMLELFESEGLGKPPIPRVFRSSLQARGHWCFASREIESGWMYGFQRYPSEVVASGVENYVAVSHGGHGINSYAITYHLVYERLALFAQTLWGGAYTATASASARVAAQFERCAELINIYETYAAADLLPSAPARLIVIESDLGGRGMARWLPEPTGDDESAADWLEPSVHDTEAPIDVAPYMLADTARQSAEEHQ